MSLILDVQEKPKNIFAWLGLSVQHVFAMFGATVLVPILTGLDISVALFASGIGTLIYILCTKAKVPVYLGSSFAYIGAINVATSASGGINSAFIGLIVVGLIYILVAGIVALVGTKWINFVFPPVVVGPMIAVIGLGLANVAINDAGLNGSKSWEHMVAALVAFLVTIVIAVKGRGFFQIIPFLLGITAGYLTAVVLGIVNFDSLKEASFFAIPNFKFFGTYKLDFQAVATFAPLAFVTICEHIGDHKVLGEVCGKDFLQEPGLSRTLLGDGIATAVSGMIGGPANTTYGENTGVVAMTRVGSVWVTGTAAVIAIFMSFFGIVSGFISTIPTSVLGGISIVLFGLIASNGIKVIKNSDTDLNNTKNIVIIAAMLVIGLGGAQLKITSSVSITGMALAALVGVGLNILFKVLDAILPDNI